MAILSNINNLLRISNSTGRVLINSTNAIVSNSEVLTVGGRSSLKNDSSSVAALVIVNGDSTANTFQPYMYFSDVGGNRAGFGVEASTASLKINAQANIIFSTGATSLGGTEKMRIDSSGDVTIQTSGADDIKNFTINSSNGSSQVASLIIQNDGANGYVHFKAGAGNATPTTKLTIGNAANSGNVGIGDTTPSFPLVISKSSSTVSNGADLSMRLGLTNPDQTNNNWALITFGDGTSQPGSGFFGMQFTDHTNNYGDLCFGTRGTTGYGEKMRITSGGNVGIGVTNPETARLLVRGSTNDSTSQIFQAANLGGATKYVVRADGDNKWYKSDNSQSMVLTSGGDVGIGRTAPNYKLVVSNSNAEGIEFGPGYGSANNLWQNYNRTSSTYVKETHYASTYAFLTAGGNTGNVGIGAESPIEKLQVEGGAYINGRDIGKGVNLATSQGWTALSAGNVNSVLGYFGGNFSRNGASNENEIIWGTNQANQRTLIWKSTNNNTGSDDDGGWNKGISTGNDNMGYVSYVYVKRTNASTNGSFYFGCSGGNTLNLAGTAIGNPYFQSVNIGTLPLNVWCLAIGHIQANNDSNTVNNGDTGIWRLDTGIKIYGGTSYKMGTNGGSQSHRTYLYYSTDPVSTLSWVDPGFYAIDGTQPTMGELLNTNGLPSVSEASLWTRKTLDSNVVITGNIAITALTHTYTYPAPHALYISGGFTTTPASSGVAYSAHFTMFVDGTTQALVDQHETPPEWWRQGFAFMTQDLTSGSHTITVNALNQDGNFNIVGGGGGGGGIYSQIVYRIIPL